MGDLMDKQELNYLNETRRVHQWKMAFFGLLFLIVGIVIGAGVGVLVLGRRPLPPQAGPDQYIQRVTQRMERELNLSEPQARQMRQIVSEHLESLDLIRRETRPRIEEEIAIMNRRILEVLDEPQQRTWQEMARRLNNRLDEPREEGGRGGFGPGPRGPGFGRQESEGRGPGLGRPEGEGRGPGFGRQEEGGYGPGQRRFGGPQEMQRMERQGPMMGPGGEISTPPDDPNQDPLPM